MSYNRKTWVDHIEDEQGNVIQAGTPLSAENLNNIEAGIEENTEQLFNIEQNIEEKENQIAKAIKTPSLEGCGLKFLVRSDAEIVISSSEEVKTITCPDNKLLYIISFRIVNTVYTNRAKTDKIGYVTIDSDKYICPFGSEKKYSFTDSTAHYDKKYYIQFANILFGENLICGAVELPMIANNNSEGTQDISNYHFTIKSNPVTKIELNNSEVTYLLLDKDKGGIDYNDFN